MTQKYTAAKVRWTAEEVSLLKTEWLAWMKTCGQARRGFIEHMMQVLPGRSAESIHAAKRQLVQRGDVPPHAQRRKHPKLHLLTHQSAWLAGILDGEGSIPLRKRTSHKGKPNGYSVQIVLATNTNWAVIQRVQDLVPFGKVHGKPRVLGNKTCWAVVVSGYAAMYDVLENLLPYIVESDKREKAIALYAFCQERLNIGGGL